MKNQDDLIKNIFEGIDSEVNYSSDLEDQIMLQVGKEKDHAKLIQKYKKWSLWGTRISILLLLIMGGFFILPLFSHSDFYIPNGIESYLPTLYAFLAISILFFQLELKKSL